jgi:hypothetical protein
MNGSITGTNNIAIGSAALALNNSTSNIAIGQAAMSSSGSGTENIAIGTTALLTNNSFQNIAIGGGAMAASGSGFSNIAIGTATMGTSASGANNIAIGGGSLLANNGNSNIAIGAGTMATSVSGIGNIAIGNGALPINNSTNNIAIGDGVLAANVIGSGNIAIGDGAMATNTLATNSIAIGNGAGTAIPASLNTITIGTIGNPVAPPGAIQIGTPVINSACFIQGIFNVPLVGFPSVAILPTGQLGLGLPSPSSKIYKNTIQDLNKESELIYQLRPVSFYYNKEMNEISTTHNISQEKQYGLIAEEVEEIIPEFIIKHPYDTETTYSVDYTKLIPLLLNEAIKMKNRVDKLTEEKNNAINELKKENAQMAAVIKNLIARIEDLEDSI